ncbi:DUF1330 domain-containing protein [Nocardioides sp. B-3]|uniref:DUF1330 domain-containing protein n=1 Tax=Nocardioides sp. B-3 TaxID=2895565 RepID=UPI002152B5E7|nr:DUF1330 domain-containing protein [Nocardioides sp. B-3]UUZ60845.1 DUF1330 domain-containing protein [Nocardioides sp. B-3]
MTSTSATRSSSTSPASTPRWPSSAGASPVHGGEVDGVEGVWDGDVIVIEFPDRETARAWYDSAIYRAILPLRTEHSNGIAAIVGGVPRGYRATDGLAAMLASST